MRCTALGAKFPSPTALEAHPARHGARTPPRGRLEGGAGSRLGACASPLSCSSGASAGTWTARPLLICGASASVRLARGPAAPLVAHYADGIPPFASCQPRCVESRRARHAPCWCCRGTSCARWRAHRRSRSSGTFMPLIMRFVLPRGARWLGPRTRADPITPVAAGTRRRGRPRRLCGPLLPGCEEHRHQLRGPGRDSGRARRGLPGGGLQRAGGGWPRPPVLNAAFQRGF